MAEHDVCPLAELPPNHVRVVQVDDREIAVFNANGDLYAIEDRCTHDDGPLADGDFDPDSCVVSCPRHGAQFDVTTGKALTLPAYIPVATFPVRVVEGIVRIEV